MPTILIVDDIFANRILLTEIAKGLKIKSKAVNNGKEAYDIICENPEQFHLILMDIEMPVMNGLETTAKLRQHSDSAISNIPIVALTAHNPQDFFQDFTTVGFNELLTKPYSIPKLHELIKRHCPDCTA